MSDSGHREGGLRRALRELGGTVRWLAGAGECKLDPRQAQAELAATRTELTAATARLGELRAELARVSEEVRDQRGFLHALAARTEDLGGRQEQGWKDFQTESSRIAAMVPADIPLHGTGTFSLERFDAGLGGEVVGFRDGGFDEQGRLYVGFEDFFRGSEELIRERQQAYRPLLEGRAPVLDAGCGRGEMLELLRDWGVEAAGIDFDPAMVAHCHAKGLESVQVADAADYLEAAGDGAFGAVFAGQLIEHLPYPDLVRFVRAARRALGPGGILIAETVNPHAPQGLKHFWLDPTHQHPLFPEAVIALCRLSGFSGAFVWYPQGSGDPDRDRLEQLDFAVVAQVEPLRALP